MLLYTWAQWGHYLNGFLNVPVVLDIGGHMVCCLFICLCIFMILFADFDSIFYLSAVSKSTLKWFAHLSGVQNTSILFCLFICTPIFFSNFFFQSSYRLLYYQAFDSLSPCLSTIWNTIAQSFHTQSGFDSLSVLAKQTAEAPAAAAVDWALLYQDGHSHSWLLPCLHQGTSARSSWKQRCFPFLLGSSTLPSHG